MSHDFRLDPRLAGDCHPLGSLELSELLLMNNALVPWLILVPRVAETELYRLGQERTALLMDEIEAVSRCLVDAFAVHKLNVAALGNVVEQLHVHVVGRRRDDPYWPGVVWGAAPQEAYGAAALDEVRERVARALAARLRPAA
jgi:diadenosine tetraphosphate (Ap4A) HIT family hydrolase